MLHLVVLIDRLDVGAAVQHAHKVADDPFDLPRGNQKSEQLVKKSWLEVSCVARERRLGAHARLGFAAEEAEVEHVGDNGRDLGRHVVQLLVPPCFRVAVRNRAVAEAGGIMLILHTGDMRHGD